MAIPTKTNQETQVLYSVTPYVNEVSVGKSEGHVDYRGAGLYKLEVFAAFPGGCSSPAFLDPGRYHLITDILTIGAGENITKTYTVPDSVMLSQTYSPQGTYTAIDQIGKGTVTVTISGDTWTSVDDITAKNIQVSAASMGYYTSDNGVKNTTNNQKGIEKLIPTEISPSGHHFGLHVSLTPVYINTTRVRRNLSNTGALPVEDTINARY